MVNIFASPCPDCFFTVFAAIISSIGHIPSVLCCHCSKEVWVGLKGQLPISKFKILVDLDFKAPNAKI